MLMEVRGGKHKSHITVSLCCIWQAQYPEYPISKMSEVCWLPRALLVFHRGALPEQEVTRPPPRQL